MSSAPASSITDPFPAPRESKRRDLIEIAVAYALILLVIWTPRPWQRYLWLIAALGIAAIVALSFDDLRSMGLRSRSFFRSLWVVGGALIAAAVTVAIAARLHTLRSPGSPMEMVRSFWGYALWAGVQQFLLQCFFLSRLLRLLVRRQLAVFAAAGLFTLAHLPNPVLVALSIVWGALACLIFLRYRNVYSLAIAHAVFGITIAITVPGQVDHNMRVGLGYLRYQSDLGRTPLQRSHRDQMVSTHAWVTADAATRRPALQARP